MCICAYVFFGNRCFSLIWSFFNSCNRKKETSLKFKRNIKYCCRSLFFSLSLFFSSFFFLNDQTRKKIQNKTKKIYKKKQKNSILCNDILKSKQTNEMIQKEKEQRSLAKLIKYRWKCATNCGNRFKMFKYCYWFFFFIFLIPWWGESTISAWSLLFSF